MQPNKAIPDSFNSDMHAWKMVVRWKAGGRSITGPVSGVGSCPSLLSFLSAHSKIPKWTCLAMVFTSIVLEHSLMHARCTLPTTGLELYVKFGDNRLWAQNLRVLSTVQPCHNSLVRLDTLYIMGHLSSCTAPLCCDRIAQ